MEFKVNMVLEEEDFCGLSIINTKRKKAYLFNRVIQITIAIGICFSIVLLMVSVLFSWIFYREKFPVTNIILCIIFLYLPYVLIFEISAKKLGKKMWKKYDEKGTEIQYFFSEEYMITTTPKNEKNLKHS